LPSSGGCVFLLVIVARAWTGQLPIGVSTQGLTYTAEEAKETARSPRPRSTAWHPDALVRARRAADRLRAIKF
jgi:hypothetical protein